MARYLILESVKEGKPEVFFYDRNSRKWRVDRYYGDVQEAIKRGKRMRKFGYDVIKI